MVVVCPIDGAAEVKDFLEVTFTLQGEYAQTDQLYGEHQGQQSYHEGMWGLGIGRANGRGSPGKHFIILYQGLILGEKMTHHPGVDIDREQQNRKPGYYEEHERSEQKA